MKRFSCGDVVAGCKATFFAGSDGEILARVAEHARDDHQMPSVSQDVVDAVKAHIHDVADAS